VSVVNGARLLEFLSASLDGARVGLAEPPAPVTGGFDTQIYTLRLVGAPPALSGPLILRILGPHYDPRRALREQAIQNALAAQGYPAPRAPLASADPGILGAGFLIMERMPGRTLLDDRRLGMAGVVVRAQRRLHALDPAPVLKAVEAAVPGGAKDHTVEGHIAQLETRIVRGALLGLAPALGWLRANRPAVEGPHVICHGDFHPLNILVNGSREVTGVLDWPNVLFAERACDVAASRVILRHAPVDLAPLPRHLRWLVRAARLALARRFMAGHRRAEPLDKAALRYYEALACMRQLVRVAENRVAARRNSTTLNPLDASRFGERLAGRFARLTGVRPALPAAEETTSR
jgi:aminoglycoside phosphotransferase (APT) family kinase protein